MRPRILALLLLVGLRLAAQAVPDVGCRAEWDRPTDILVHTPGDELFCGVVHPEAGLFERPFDIAAAAAEHRAYQDRLRAEGVRVHTLIDALMTGPVDELRAFAGRFLTFDTAALPADERAEQERYKQAVLDGLSPRELARLVFDQPTVRLRPSAVPNTRYSATYELAPVMNLYFTRDQQITTARGVVTARMNSEQRAVETEILGFALSRLGITPIGAVTGDGRLEGGDFLPAGDIAFVGQGLRTNAEGVRQLLEQQVFGCRSVVIVHDPWRNQVQMHLDTWFNLLGPKLAVMVADRMDHRDAAGAVTTPADPLKRPTADVWELGDAGYRKVREGLDFQAFLEGDLGMTVVPVSVDDQLTYGVNFLCLGVGRAIGVAGQSPDYQRALAAAGARVEWLDMRNLTGGYGAAHCCTQVLRRVAGDASPAAPRSNSRAGRRPPRGR